MNTNWCTNWTQLEAINSGALMALVWFVRHRTKPAVNVFHSCPQICRSDKLHDIYESRCSKISFCSTVARIRLFPVNNKPGWVYLNEYTQVTTQVDFQFNEMHAFILVCRY